MSPRWHSRSSASSSSSCSARASPGAYSSSRDRSGCGQVRRSCDRRDSDAVPALAGTVGLFAGFVARIAYANQLTLGPYIAMTLFLLLPQVRRSNCSSCGAHRVSASPLPPRIACSVAWPSRSATTFRARPCSSARRSWPRFSSRAMLSPSSSVDCGARCSLTASDPSRRRRAKRTRIVGRGRQQDCARYVSLITRAPLTFAAGVIIQLVFIGSFTLLFLTFGLRVRSRFPELWQRGGASVGRAKDWRVVWAVGLVQAAMFLVRLRSLSTRLLVQVRSAFRAVEFAQGYGQGIRTVEGALYGLDFLPMAIASTCAARDISRVLTIAASGSSSGRLPGSRRQSRAIRWPSARRPQRDRSTRRAPAPEARSS